MDSYSLKFSFLFAESMAPPSPTRVYTRMRRKAHSPRAGGQDEQRPATRRRLDLPAPPPSVTERARTPPPVEGIADRLREELARAPAQSDEAAGSAHGDLGDIPQDIMIDISSSSPTSRGRARSARSQRSTASSGVGGSGSGDDSEASEDQLPLSQTLFTRRQSPRTSSPQSQRRGGPSGLPPRAPSPRTRRSPASSEQRADSPDSPIARSPSPQITETPDRYAAEDIDAGQPIEALRFTIEGSREIYDEGFAPGVRRQHERPVTAEAIIRLPDAALFPDSRELITHYGLEWVTQAPGLYYPRLVREFYAAYLAKLRAEHYGDQRHIRTAACLYGVMVRGRYIRIRERDIRRALTGVDARVPRDECVEYTRRLRVLERWIPPEERLSHYRWMAGVLTPDGRPAWRDGQGDITRASLTQEARFAWHVVRLRLQPSDGDGRLSRASAVLVASMLSRYEVRVYDVIKREMHRRALETGTAMPFACLITTLCLQAGCRLDPLADHSTTPTTYSAIQLLRAPEAPIQPAAAPEFRVASPPPPLAAEPTIATQEAGPGTQPDTAPSPPIISAPDTDQTAEHIPAATDTAAPHPAPPVSTSSRIRRLERRADWAQEQLLSLAGSIPGYTERLLLAILPQALDTAMTRAVDSAVASALIPFQQRLDTLELRVMAALHGSTPDHLVQMREDIAQMRADIQAMQSRAAPTTVSETEQSDDLDLPTVALQPIIDPPATTIQAETPMPTEGEQMREAIARSVQTAEQDAARRRSMLEGASSSAPPPPEL